MRKTRALFMTLIILIVSIQTVWAESVSVLDENSSSLQTSKIDEALAELLKSAGDNDLVSVAIWFTDIQDSVKNAVIKEEVSKSIIDENIKKSLTNNCINATRISEIPFISDLSKETIDNLSKRYALSMSEKMADYNQKMTHQLIKLHGISLKIKYCNKLSPMILADLTKRDLLKIEKSALIDRIYYESNNYYSEPTTYTPQTRTKSTPSSYGYWQSNTNINLLRSYYNLSGSNMKIGLVDTGYPDTSDVTLQYAADHHFIHAASIEYGSTVSDDATYFASVLVGRYGDYYGIVPNAMLYYSTYSPYVTGSIYDAVNVLILEQIKIIDISSFLGAKESTYDTISKYIDYIAFQYDTIICLPVGDAQNSSQINSICNGAMAYNAIAVGNIDNHNTNSMNDDSIRTSSCYTNGNSIAYKPDICAPGTNVYTYSFQYEPLVSTRTAATVVTGICAQLAQNSNYFHPMKIKSAIQSSAYRLPSMVNGYSWTYGNNMIMDRDYGSGMIDAYSSYMTLYNNHVYSDQVVPSSLPSTITYEVNVTAKDIKANRDIYISLNWYNNVDAIPSNVMPSEDTTFLIDTPYYHNLILHSPSITGVAVSGYYYDHKEYIHYHPTVSGTYTIEIFINNLSLLTPAYVDEYAVAYCVR